MIGKRVTILPGHFCARESGIVTAEQLSIIGPMLRVDLESGRVTCVPPAMVKVAL